MSFSNQAALDANKALDDRFKAVRAWIGAHPEAAPKLKHLDVHFNEWDAYQDTFAPFRDPTRLQGFEGELAQVEDEAARFGYIPGEHVTVGDLMDRVPGGKAAEDIDDAAKDLEKKIKDLPTDIPAAIPWWGYALAGLTIIGLGVGAGIAFQLNPAVAMARAMADTSTRRRY